jgi:predicted enzyme related to lactoylglutathione lyase
MPMIESIYSVAVVVSDRKKAAQWYKEKLGFAIKEESEEHWTIVGPPSWPSGLHLCEGDLEPGNTGILLYPDDFDKTVQELKNRGVQFTQEPKKEPWGTYAMFKDPDGNEFWLMPKQ